ncbi:hypothetical protein M2451_002647 [Dysgonomonas sp. PFB1-18]|uniref:hypothetical protein n=1 Tax=unclassified Dysgonomonas TaxID=2630389 RepID=UPI0024743F29|nr:MULTISPECIES: hypothetical protein [unclassified Dysgonomonas]MDH6308128.1 hypothetical protein [Dysgonomonas sp. PF1-14]MDH6339667.1 hypothetical protein [Dysgonomonas sp. PF1-16]MDH6381318.1 hypothetical protein [Dysgonomonas sp. PFB1-18]MDH6398530.1 hypothetical protein [Dysgonomonas sp. PF1-23]
MDRINELKNLMQTGHCAESISMLHNTNDNAKKLMETYFYYIKACTQKDFPKLEFLRTHFGKQVAPFGGYVDATGEQKAHRNNALVGDSNVTMRTEGYNIVKCWVRHNSKLEVTATENSHLHIDCFENTEVKICIEGNAKVFVNQYGQSKVEISGNTANASVKLFDCETYK